MQFPLMCLVISGGHTELVYMKEHYSFEVIGSTLDDAVGECFDKVARVIGVGYPGGPTIDKLAKNGEDTYNLPIPLNDDSYNFSFSGLKSAVINLNHNENQKGNILNKENLCSSFENRVVTSLVTKTIHAMEEYNVKNLVLAGGVAANSLIREKFTLECEKKGFNFSYPSIKYCTDNATMIAVAGYYCYKLGRKSDLDLNGKSSEKLQ